MDVDEVVLVSSDSNESASPLSWQRDVSEVISSTSTYTGEASTSSSEKVNAISNKRVYHTLSESDSDDPDTGSLCNQNFNCEAASTENVQTMIQEGQLERKRKKRRNIPKEEVLKKKEEERKLKEEKRRQLLIQKSLKPGECLKHVTVLLDSSLLQCKFGGKLLAAVQSTESPSRIVSNLVPFTVGWERSLPNLESTEESQVLLVWHYDELISAVVEGKLCERICDIRNVLVNKDIILLVYGLQEYFSKKEKVKDTKLPSEAKSSTCLGSKLTRHKVENALAELQLQLNFGYRVINTPEELGLCVTQFTKAVAEHPFKKQKFSKEQKFSWYAALDSRDCVRVDKEGNGLLRLWQQQLTQFNLAGVDKAQAIVAAYPSPQLLKQAYDKCDSTKEAELLLQNIAVRRTQGPLTSFRRIGPELTRSLR